MKRKKSLILMATLAMLLGISTAVYAWMVQGSSAITTGIITMTGSSWTTSDVLCSTLYVDNTLYKDGHVAGGSTKSASNSNSVSTTCTGANTLGNQYWELYGIHQGTSGGVTKTVTSYHEVIY